MTIVAGVEALVLIGLAMLVASQERRVRRAQRLAERDALTGVLNRRGWHLLLAKSARSAPPGTVVAVIDLVGLKEANTAGHAAGDALLKQAAARLAELAGETAAVARLGGDEFAAVVRTSPSRDSNAFATRVEVALAAAGVDALAGAAHVDHHTSLKAAWRTADDVLTAKRLNRQGRMTTQAPRDVAERTPHRNAD